MEKINIAELLKDCPSGMELDCTSYDNVSFDKISDDKKVTYPIFCYITDKEGNRSSISFTENGCESKRYGAKCVIFPKGKTTWDGFQRPFKDGDIVAGENYACSYITIFRKFIDDTSFSHHVCLTSLGKFKVDDISDNANLRFATEEEKQKLFDAIKANGYKWNEETNTLVKLDDTEFKIEKGKWYVCTKDLLDNYANKAFCKGGIYLSTQDGSLIPSNSNVPFKVVCASTYFKDWTIQDAKDGDVIFYDDGWTCIFKCIHGIWYSSYCFITDDGEFHTGYERHAVDFTINGNAHLATKEQSNLLFQAIKDNGFYWNAETKTLEKLVEPKFKVGDRIKHKEKTRWVCTIARIEDRYYADGHPMCYTIPFGKQDEYELVPNKFDITTLKPFDKVLYRRQDKDTWFNGFYSFYRNNCHFVNSTVLTKQCIPYENNEHLLDTTNDCDEYYKTWE